MTRLEISKKLLCCTGFTVQKVGNDGAPDQTLTDDFVTAASDFIGKCEAILGAAEIDATIAVPIPEGADNAKIILNYLGAVADAAGRILGNDLEWPDSEFVLALTGAEEAILHG